MSIAFLKEANRVTKTAAIPALGRGGSLSDTALAPSCGQSTVTFDLLSASADTILFPGRMTAPYRRTHGILSEGVNCCDATSSASIGRLKELLTGSNGTLKLLAGRRAEFTESPGLFGNSGREMENYDGNSDSHD